MNDTHRGGGRGSNPWNRGGGRGGYNQNHASRKKPSPEVLAQNKFYEAQARLQASVQKHIKQEYDSSSEEEELQSDNILGSVLQLYSQIGGKIEDLGRTQRFLEDAFQSGAASCLICIGSVKRNDAIWNCVECYCFFHLTCVQRWAKDSVAHQKQALEDQPRGFAVVSFKWACPKCRHDYDQNDTPQRYRCFCGQTEDPSCHPWLVPHSCGETCGKALLPLCGHNCLLLCHPGPCPPCPKMVKTECFCGNQPPRLQRCSNKTWSCGSKCGHTLGCERHACIDVCHPGACPPCPKTSVQSCECGQQKVLRPCATPNWQCEQKCGEALSCGNHKCARDCHSGSCGPCPLTEARSCPCGKASFILPCTQETPTCGDTCGHTLECGAHVCSRSCHRDKCGSCLMVVTKKCRCGLHSKELPCQKEFLCETKCKQTKDCMRHPCNRKCCDGNCPPCEKPCGRTLQCGNHKCTSVCHRGPCYPCPLTAEIKCHCGLTVLTVPCGRKKQTRPPRCSKPCSGLGPSLISARRIKPNCHHPSREPHRCHFGDCPPCQQVCGMLLDPCKHKCPAPCHSAVWVKVEEDQKKPVGPWDKVQPQVELKALPCPRCKVPVPVMCLGSHETLDWPCYVANPTSCERECGRMLMCGNHTCRLLCHTVEGAPNETAAGDNCEQCELGCTKPRPEGCTHICQKPCHSGDCPPCSHMLRVQCHCSLAQLYVRCSEWTSAEDDKKQALTSCGNQCPKNYECGHRCRILCHPGDCPDPDMCRKKVKLTCPCRRLRKEFPCDVVRTGHAKVDCDDICRQKKEQEMKIKEQEKIKKQLEEERQNQKEVEKFLKKFQARKKHRERHRFEEQDSSSFFAHYWVLLFSLLGVLMAFYYLFLS
ncbi:NF-X1-type zinc finger protein NFXL1 isoform X3 [Zootermopsis nevadensis]|nr:NF-X1-type zinc finger protein NFXL1 isoform X3 [Zootermopsis nevadensis]XP_021938983.1 NF-X1-type zinc finger protein NFXL1 isoform X3 [Zootermopsis nevadensis]XP_021938984.1 NF-X1-type zinc finger protein NFXL1 isoform X3 [Zootermopsis nevadensis]